MLLAFRLTPNNKGVFEPLTETVVDPRKTFIGGNGYELRYWKPSLGKPRPDLERENPIVLWLAAEMVLECAEQIVGEPIPREYVEKLVICARDVYGASAPSCKRFRAKVRGKHGNKHLIMFMQHWLHAHLKHNNWPLADKLPPEFHWPKETWRDRAT